MDFNNGEGWWHRILERYPNLPLRKGDALALPRATATTAANMNEYYSPLKTTLEEQGIMNRPSRIYNMDESGMPLDHKPPRVVARKGTKKIHCHTSGNKSQITILACANAVGTTLPPMVIFQQKQVAERRTRNSKKQDSANDSGLQSAAPMSVLFA